jgi:hypothetical protein
MGKCVLSKCDHHSDAVQAQGYNGSITRRQYADLYYRDFLDYCNTKK